MLDPATSVSVAAPIPPLQVSATSIMLVDRTPDLAPGWLLIRVFDANGVVENVPQLVSLDTGVGYDVPNVPR